MLVQILVDNIDSWVIPYANELCEKLKKKGCEAHLVHQHSEVKQGEILCLLACEKVFKNLHLNKHNLVVHESDLPSGKGWSPVTWQVLEGKNKIPVTLFEANKKLDAGNIYAKEYMYLEGHELIDEIKDRQGKVTQTLIMDFIKAYPNVVSIPQKGKESFYSRRRPEDSKMDISKSIKEQFNLLRVCDNERYPAYFERNGIRYQLKIYKDDQRF